METAIVSGRVEVGVKERAGAYIKAAGLTPADVIKRVWEHIAQTGFLPFENPDQEVANPAVEEFFAFCDELNAGLSNEDRAWFAGLTDEKMRDYVTEGLVEKYEGLA